MNDEAEYLNVQEVADALGTNRRRVWQLIKEGELVTVPNPLDRRQKLVSRDQVERLSKYTKAAA